MLNSSLNTKIGKEPSIGNTQIYTAVTEPGDEEVANYVVDITNTKNLLS